jgi:hypothetical protein
MMKTGPTSTKKLKRWLKAFIVLIAAAVLALIFFNIYFVMNPTTISSVTSNGSPAFSIFDGNFTFLIDNTLSNNMMRVHGLQKNIEIKISASDLIEDASGGIISSTRILLIT